MKGALLSRIATAIAVALVGMAACSSPEPPEAERLKSPFAAFAATCGELAMAEPENGGRKWLAKMETQAPPPELADFWRHRLDRARGDGSTMTEEELALSNLDHRQLWALIDAECISMERIILGPLGRQAEQRLLMGFGQRGHVSLLEFAAACADIKYSSPAAVYLTWQDLAAHRLYWWERLRPPPVVEQVQRANIQRHRDFAAEVAEWETEDGEAMSQETFDRGWDAYWDSGYDVRSAQWSLPPVTRKIVSESGCY